MRCCATSPRSSPNPPSITRSEIIALGFRFGHEIGLYAQSAGSGTALQLISIYAAESLTPKCTPTPGEAPKRERDEPYSSIELRDNRRWRIFSQLALQNRAGWLMCSGYYYEMDVLNPFRYFEAFFGLTSNIFRFPTLQKATRLKRNCNF